MKMNKYLQDELHRCRTTETTAAHALDSLRQDLGLPLIDGESPMSTVSRIKQCTRNYTGIDLCELYKYMDDDWEDRLNK